MTTTNELQHEHQRAMEIIENAITSADVVGARSIAVRAQMIVEGLDEAGLLRTPPLVEAAVYDVEVEGGRFLQLTVLVDDAVEEQITGAITVGIRKAFDRQVVDGTQATFLAELEADARMAAVKWFYEGGRA